MNMNVKLPVMFELGDYHEVRYLQEMLRKVVKGIKVIETGFKNGKYIAVAYVGSAAKSENQSFIKKYSTEDC